MQMLTQMLMMLQQLSALTRVPLWLLPLNRPPLSKESRPRTMMLQIQILVVMLLLFALTRTLLWHLPLNRSHHSKDIRSRTIVSPVSFIPRLLPLPQT